MTKLIVSSLIVSEVESKKNETQTNHVICAQSMFKAKIKM